MYTILNEFSQYSEQSVLSFSPQKVQIVYKEALRQRASKYSLLARLINEVHFSKDEDRRKLHEYVDKMLKPHFVVSEVTDQKQIDDTWAALRAGI